MGPGFSYGPDDWFRSRMGWGYPLSLPERKQNINCRIMRQLIFPVAKKAKRLGGKRHVLIQKSPSSWRRNIRCRIMRHLIFSIVGSTPESPSVNPPGAGTIGFETEYQVQHNVAPDILLECRLLFYSWHVLHGQALPGSMSGSLKTILRGSTSRVNMPNTQSNDCAGRLRTTATGTPRAATWLRDH